MYKLLYAGMGLAVVFASCRSQEKVGSSDVDVALDTANLPVELPLATPVSTATVGVASPRVFVYRMTNPALYDRVPVMMNAARTAIVSYPAPSDLRRGNNLCLPTQLLNGYLLDNRGIGPNVALLSYTYAQYAALTETPSMEELMAHLLDKNPLSWYTWCGRWSDYSDIVSELNTKIEQGELGMPEVTLP